MAKKRKATRAAHGYHVRVRVEYSGYAYVEADSAEEAIKKADDNDFDQEDFFARGECVNCEAENFAEDLGPV
jgi:hypothetical protein